MKKRIGVLILFALCFCTCIAQEMSIEGFRLLETDLTANTRGTSLQDQNGETAALIKVVTIQTGFSFDCGSIGVVRVIEMPAEIWVYIPRGTKKITISHPQIGLIRDYFFPVPIDAGRTYELILKTKNLPSQGYVPQVPEMPTTVMDSQNIENDTQPILPDKKDDTLPEVTIIENKPKENFHTGYEPPTYNNTTTQNTTEPTSTNELGINMVVKLGYNAIGMSGPSLSMGIDIGRFHAEGLFVYGLNPIEGLDVFYKTSDDLFIGESFEKYRVNRFGLNFGVNINPNDIVQVVPQTGMIMNYCYGEKSTYNNNLEEAQFSNTYPISLSLSVELRLKLSSQVYIYMTPQYNITVIKDDVYDVLTKDNSKFKSWSEGFGVNAGLLFRL